MHLFGIDWLGLTPANGRRLLLSVGFIVAVLLVGRLLRALAGAALGWSGWGGGQTRFWVRQGISLTTALVLILGTLSIWFSDPARLATAFGLISAGLAFALQQLITSIAGYFVILRGNTFTIGDRISMGGVRGDVMPTRLHPDDHHGNGPARRQRPRPRSWIHSRQFTGRIVSVANSKIFAEPVFNYTSDFPFIWEELSVPLHFDADSEAAEAILLEAAREHAVGRDDVDPAIRDRLAERFGMAPTDLRPRVYQRITHDWPGADRPLRKPRARHEGREGCDDRRVMKQFRQAGIAIASTRLQLIDRLSTQPELDNVPGRTT